MARIKLFGIQELVECDNSQGKEIDRMWKSDEYDKESIISVGNFSATKKDIRFISFGREIEYEDKVSEYIKEYNEYRNSLLELEPKKRAERVAWPHFSLFHYGLFRKGPDGEDKEKVIEHCEKFFEENRMWARPSCLTWYQFLGDNSKSIPMQRMTFQVLCGFEERELQDVYEGKKYQNELREQERKGEIAIAESFDVGYEVKAEDIPF